MKLQKFLLTLSLISTSGVAQETVPYVSDFDFINKAMDSAQNEMMSCFSSMPKPNAAEMAQMTATLNDPSKSEAAREQLMQEHNNKVMMPCLCKQKAAVKQLARLTTEFLQRSPQYQGKVIKTTTPAGQKLTLDFSQDLAPKLAELDKKCPG